MAAGHPLLQAPRIRAVAQHVEIVVGLEDQDVEVAQPPPGEAGAAADVGDQADPPAAGVLDHEAHRLAGVVGDQERLDAEARDLARLAGADLAAGPDRLVAQPALASVPAVP